MTIFTAAGFRPGGSELLNEDASTTRVVYDEPTSQDNSLPMVNFGSRSLNPASVFWCLRNWGDLRNPSGMTESVPLKFETTSSSIAHVCSDEVRIIQNSEQQPTLQNESLDL